MKNEEVKETQDETPSSDGATGGSVDKPYEEASSSDEEIDETKDEVCFEYSNSFNESPSF